MGRQAKLKRQRRLERALNLYFTNIREQDFKRFMADAKQRSVPLYAFELDMGTDGPKIDFVADRQTIEALSRLPTPSVKEATL